MGPLSPVRTPVTGTVASTETPEMERLRPAGPTGSLGSYTLAVEPGPLHTLTGAQ